MDPLIGKKAFQSLRAKKAALSETSECTFLHCSKEKNEFANSIYCTPKLAQNQITNISSIDCMCTESRVMYTPAMGKKICLFFLIPESQCLPSIPHTNNLLHALTSTNRKLPLFINW